MSGKTVTCLKCGWVHFEVSREYAEDEVIKFTCYFNTLTPEQQQDFYGGRTSKVLDYEQCMVCGGSYKNFRDSLSNDCPDGCTLNPIIQRAD